MTSRPQVSSVRSSLNGGSRKIGHSGKHVSKCKLCPNMILVSDDRIWSTRPIGLVHVECASHYEAPTLGPVTKGVDVRTTRSTSRYRDTT